MGSIDNKRYILELFKYVSQESILIINNTGHLERLNCPFYVKVLVDIYSLRKGSVKAVKAVRISVELLDVYIIESKAYYHFNFIILGRKDKMPKDES